MADNSSAYPAAIDGQPPFLVDDHDFVPVDALTFLISQIAAIQTEIGAGATDFTALGGNATEFSSLAELLGALYRFEIGNTQITTTDPQEPFTVTFTEGRFTEPPFVFISGSNTAAPGQDNYFEAKNVTSTEFQIGDAKLGSGWGGSKYVQWIAIQPLWGLEQDLEF